MKIVIILAGRGGELDRKEIDSDADVSAAIAKLALHTWIIDVGDTITVTTTEE